MVGLLGASLVVLRDGQGPIYSAQLRHLSQLRQLRADRIAAMYHAYIHGAGAMPLPPVAGVAQHLGSVVADAVVLAMGMVWFVGHLVLALSCA